MIRVLVTGATGFIGRAVVNRLIDRGYDVAVAVRNPQKAFDMFGHRRVKVIDVHTPDFAKALKFLSPDVCIHLAACFDPQPDEVGITRLLDTNLLFTIKLMEALRNTSCRLVINAGTFSEFYQEGPGDAVSPQNLYSATKSAQRPIMSYYRSACGWKWVNMIVFTPYGRVNSTKKVIDYMVEALDAPEPVEFSGGEQVLDFVHVDDIAELVCRIIERIDSLGPEEELHAGTGTGHSLRQVAEVMERVFGSQLNAAWGARPYREREMMYAVADMGRVSELLGWQPSITLEQGLTMFRYDIINSKTKAQ